MLLAACWLVVEHPWHDPSLLYLHGFRSSPQSWKARLLADAFAARGLASQFHCPALSHDPAIAIAQAEAILARHPGHFALAGSSLGGYYATWLAEKHDLRAVLINPAVVAPLSLEAYVGPQTGMYDGETFEFCMRISLPCVGLRRRALLRRAIGFWSRKATRCWTIARPRRAMPAAANPCCRAATTASRGFPSLSRKSLNSAGYNPPDVSTVRRRRRLQDGHHPD